MIREGFVEGARGRRRAARGCHDDEESGSELDDKQRCACLPRLGVYKIVPYMVGIAFSIYSLTTSSGLGRCLGHTTPQKFLPSSLLRYLVQTGYGGAEGVPRPRRGAHAEPSTFARDSIKTTRRPPVGCPCTSPTTISQALPTRALSPHLRIPTTLPVKVAFGRGIPGIKIGVRDYVWAGSCQ